MIQLPAPEQIHGDALTDEITAAGFTQVQVTLIGDEVQVMAAELVDPMPSAKEREDAMERGRQQGLADCMTQAHTRAAAANASAAETIAAVIASHVPPPAPPEPAPLTPAEKLRSLGLTPEDLRTLLAPPADESVAS